MKRQSLLWCAVMLLHPAQGTVQVFIGQTNGLATINYQCTAAEMVRSFALDVTIDRGEILGVTNYFRGLSTAGARGYGVFPASLRDNVTVSSGTNTDWSPAAYSPLAVPADNPGGTLPGLNSGGVTLEFGAIWDPAAVAAAPPPRGMLCALVLSQTATVTVAPNAARGGVVPSPPDLIITPQFTGALVGPAILSATVNGGQITVRFQSGELESAPEATGPWTGTGNTSGTYTEAINGTPGKFFRVHLH
jgi:hypothetical protein